MVLVTGPTGSGKSTTLYTFLHSISSPEVNVITVEDPVEYQIKEVNQVQVNTKTGLTFASCLRSILRQDPNIIMVGEIRDAETAEIALQAAQTGHLVLSTLHTNDSIAAVTRLVDLGVPPFLVASSVTAIVAQRLVRKLCACAVKAPVTMDFLTRMKAAEIAVVPSYMMAPQGCPVCGQTGYKGRVGIYELLVLDDLIRAAIRAGTRGEEIRDLARANGMRMMQEDALEKVARGITTLEEVLRVVPFDNALELRCGRCRKPLSPTFPFCPNCGEKARLLPAAIQPIRGPVASIRSGGH
jgi:type IV pilus assembly protein PilB